MKVYAYEKERIEKVIELLNQIDFKGVSNVLAASHIILELNKVDIKLDIDDTQQTTELGEE